MTRHHRPPHLAERLAEAVLDPSRWSETTLGDLSEEHATLFARRGRLVADVWYWLQTLLLIRTAAVSAARRMRHAATTSLTTGDSPMRTLISEIKFAVRTLARQPLMAAAIITTMALGLGANAAAFSMLNVLVLRPFPFPDVDRLVVVSEFSPARPYDRASVSAANFIDWRRRADRFEHMAAFGWSDINMSGPVDAVHVHGSQVSGEFFQLLRMQPAVGRLLGRADDVEGGGRVLVIADSLWKRSFGERADIVGLQVLVDDDPYVVVGVAPSGFSFPLGAEFWRPLALTSTQAAERNHRRLTAIARLQPETTLDDAGAQMSVIGARLSEEHPVENRDYTPKVETFALGMIDRGLPMILGMVQVGAVVVLLIGGANIVNLLLARGTDRRREIALRLAIGGSRLRVVRQLVVESLVLSAVAVPISLVLAHVALQALKGTMPARIVRFVPGWNDMGVDLTLVAVALIGAAASALLLGLFPALQTSRPNLADTLRDGGRTLSGSQSRQRLRRFVVIGELALALPLLVAAALAASAGYSLSHGPQGYEPRGVMTLQTSLPERSYTSRDSRRQFAEHLLAEAAKLPGVTGVATVSYMPTSDSEAARMIDIDGRVPADPNDRPMLSYRVISPGYFDVMSIPVPRGREFSAEDVAASQPVALISQAMADRFWPNENPIGRRVRTVDTPESPWLTIVGITGNVIDDWFDRRNSPMLYVPLAQRPSYDLALMARTNGDANALGPGLRAALRTVDPNQPPMFITSMSQALHDRTIGLQMIGTMMAVLGGLALVLAIIGIYSLMAYDVIQRRQEIGVRMALGATRGDVVRFTLGHTGRLAGIGLAVGFGLAILAGQAVKGALFGVVSLGAPLLFGITLALCATAILASLVPARQASKVDPATALQAR